MKLETPTDRARQTEAAAVLTRASGWRLRDFGAEYAGLDYYATADDGRRLVAVLEVKCRDNAHDAYPTVWLSLRKWLALTLTATGLGVLPLFVVRFTDGVYWVNLDDVAAYRRHEVAGRARPRAANDTEPIIHVPADLFVRLPE